ncbi:hypothetical protein Bhyg_11995, partial [Pseudolycoriella hygida]
PNRQIKKAKEPEKERPPWKPVSIATPSKADKNALLKAKILDATRRALISQRIAHTSCQTDPIPSRDQQVETDGSVTIKKESPGGCEKIIFFEKYCKKEKFIAVILTQTIGIATDDILVNEIATQTARPKTSLSFATLPFRNKSDNHRIYGSVDRNILRNARSLQVQVQGMKRIEEQLWAKRNKICLDDDTHTANNKETIHDSQELEFSDDSLCDNEKTPDFCRHFSSDGCDDRGNDVEENFLNAPTLTSWTGFESSDEDDYDLPELPKRTVSEGYAPWKNFRDILVGNRLANMHLSPIPPRKANYRSKSVTWSDAQHRAVSELMFEASALLDVFDNVALLIGPDLSCKVV